MAKLPKQFAATGETMNDYSTMPKADYPFVINKSELVLTKKAKAANDPALGQILKMQARVLAGQFKGKVVFIDLNITNLNAQTVEIANKELTSICKACGKVSIDDSNELHGIPFMGRIGIEVDPDGKYPDKNFFEGYAVYDGDVANLDLSAAASSAGASNQVVDTDAPVAAKKMPWD